MTLGWRVGKEAAWDMEAFGESSGIVGKRLGSGKKTGLGGERQSWMLKDCSRRNLAQIR